MTRDNNTLIFEAVGTTYTPAEIHALAATLATPEQITARAAAMAEATGTGTASRTLVMTTTSTPPSRPPSPTACTPTTHGRPRACR